MLAPHLRRILAKAPAVLLHGARQMGLTTLATSFDAERTFIDLHDFKTLHTALRNPRMLLAQHPKAIIEGLLHAPPLLRAIDAELQRGAAPGRFLLMANRAIHRPDCGWNELSERIPRVEVGPMTRRERLGLRPASLWASLMEHRERDWIDLIDAGDGPHQRWREAVLESGMPVPALHLRDRLEQAQYFDDLIRATLEPELGERLALGQLPVVRRLWGLLAEHLGERLHQSRLASALGRSQPTVRRWLQHLLDAGMLTTVPGDRRWQEANTVGAPRIYFADTAFALHAAGYPKPRAAHLKNLIAADLRATGHVEQQRISLWHWTPYLGDGIDFLARLAGREFAIAVSTKAYPDLQDASGILAYWFEEEALTQRRGASWKRSRVGLLLHVGSETRWVHPRILAVPWWRLC